MVLSESKKRTVSLKLIAVFAMVGVTGSMFLLVQAAAAADEGPQVLSPGTWAADRALRFNPFALITSPARSEASTPSAGAAVPSADTSGSGPAERAAPPGSRGGMRGGYVPPPRIPYRPPLRSPFRPPI